MVLETPPTGIVSEAIVLWRAKVIDAKSPAQTFTMTMDGGHGSVTKKVISAMTKDGISPETTKWCLDNLFVNNAEGFIPETSPFEAVSVTYEHATYPFLLWDTYPIILYFIWTLIFGLVFKLSSREISKFIFLFRLLPPDSSRRSFFVCLLEVVSSNEKISL